MRTSLSLKTLYRSPVRTLLTFILLGVVTFAFFSQTAEYAVTAREFKIAATQYCGVGSAEVAPPPESRNFGVPSYINADPRMAVLYPEEKREKYLNELRYQPLTAEQIKAVSALPYLSSTDTRYMTAGVSDTLLRLDDGTYFYNFSARCVIEGTLTQIQYGNPEAIGSVDLGFNRLILDDCTLLAGNPAWAVENETLTIYADPLTYAEDDSCNIGGGSQRLDLMHTHDYIYDTEYVKNMTPGSRYVFVLRFNPLVQTSIEQYKFFFYLSDHLSDYWCDAVWPLDGQPDNYLDMEAFSALRELIGITNADAHTFDVVYTEDMSAILRFAEGNMSILEGRALTKEDSASACVISREVAEANNLKVGDSVTLKLGTNLFEQYKSLGALAVTPERYKMPEKAVTLEIVGIYADIDGLNQQSKKLNWSYSVNTIFVPKSLLPVDEDMLSEHEFSPSEFSFKVENAWDIPAFLEQSAPQFEEMGLRLIFSDGGWPDIARGFEEAQKLSLIKITVLSAAIAAATWFVVYLFISRKKREYAVMRALGTTKKTAARALILPLAAVAAGSVLAGSGAAWIYTVQTIARSNTLSVLKEYSVSTSIPADAAIACIAGELLLTLLIAAALMRRVAALSPLALLQGNVNRQARGKNSTTRVMPAHSERAAATLAASSGSLVSSPPNSGSHGEKAAVSGADEQVRGAGKSRSLRFVLRYIWKHQRRSAGKSVLAILLAVLLFMAVGQLALMKQSYTELCTDTVIKASFIGGLPLDTIPKLAQSGYVENPYYEALVRADLNFSNERIVFTNDIARYTGVETDITYAEGFDATCMEHLGPVLLAGEMLMAKYGLEIGETIQLTPENWLKGLKDQYIMTHRLTHSADDLTDEEILALYQDEITRMTSLVARTYTIAGVVSTASDAYADLAYTPGRVYEPLGFNTEVKLDVAEFTLADNFRSDEFRDYGKKTAGGSATDGVTLVMDTSKLENLRNSLRLLETLYPIAVTAALLIGGFLCCLVIVQSSKEAAIMRVLGTTKRKTRAILALEQILLSIAGLIVGAAVLLLYKGASLTVISGQIALFAVLYFAVIMVAAVTCSTLATRRNVLELLQTKE